MLCVAASHSPTTTTTTTIKQNSCRELYYRDPELMKSQRHVNEAVNEICCMLNVRPWQIGVFASSKGLLAGQLRMTMNDDSVICCDDNSEGDIFNLHSIIIIS